ncbi:MAG: helix-turn-helix domain-containing protein [Kiritimatiellae bacterium]|nr:helix-turn-helix domain-containing protein [Kiritimatiellia bacterium]
MNTGLTELGRFLRKLRIDRGELLRDMAKKLGVTVSFLSAVENGKRGMPSEWGNLLSNVYRLSPEQCGELDVAVAASEKGVALKFDGLSSTNRRLSAAFARKIRSFTQEEQKKLEEILL